VTGPDLDDGFGEDEFVEEFGGDEPSEPWHNSTRAVLGASVLGVAVLGVLVAAIMFVTRQDDSTTAPVEFVDPSFSATASETPSSPTTTATITSTTPPSTTEINGPPGPPTTSDSSSTTSGSDSSTRPPFTRPRERENDEEPGGPTSRRPRFNVTRTLQPQQAG
jgi:hypothetical protein